MTRERQAVLARQLAETAEDPLFLADLDEVERDFAGLEAEIDRATDD